MVSGDWETSESDYTIILPYLCGALSHLLDLGCFSGCFSTGGRRLLSRRSRWGTLVVYGCVRWVCYLRRRMTMRALVWRVLRRMEHLGYGGMGWCTHHTDQCTPTLSRSLLALLEMATVVFSGISRDQRSMGDQERNEYLSSGWSLNFNWCENGLGLIFDGDENGLSALKRSKIRLGERRDQIPQSARGIASISREWEEKRSEQLTDFDPSFLYRTLCMLDSTCTLSLDFSPSPSSSLPSSREPEIRADCPISSSDKESIDNRLP